MDDRIPMNDAVPSGLPTFSLFIETENLAVEGPEVLLKALASLQSQSVPPANAVEVILANSGEVPKAIAEQVSALYPWLRWMEIDSRNGYYEAKSLLAQNAKGEVLVFCDCDCEYDSLWLESLLTSFQEGGEAVQVVTGETAVRVRNAYTLLVSLAFAFPPHSQRQALYATQGYAFNNVAFRRTLLQRFPVPVGMGIYRGNCSRHARDLEQQGVTVWKAPRARAFHPPLKPSHILQRFYMWGHHEGRVALSRSTRRSRLRRILEVLRACSVTAARRGGMFFWRLPAQGRQGGLSVGRLLFAIPGFMVLYLLFIGGMLTTLIYPRLDLSGLGARLEADH